MPSSSKTVYSVGFVVSLDGQQVLLIQKNRPQALAGQWIGVGGHVEPGETPEQAMVRECSEECGLSISDWHPLGVAERADAVLHVFAARSPLEGAQTLTDEPVRVFSFEQALSCPRTDVTVEYWSALERFAARPHRSFQKRP